MSYRDELDAAKNRIANLEEELARVRVEQAQPAELSRPRSAPIAHAPASVESIASASVESGRNEAPWNGPFFGTPFTLGQGGSARHALIGRIAGVLAALLAITALLLPLLPEPHAGVIFTATACAFAVTPAYFGASRLIAPGLPIRTRSEHGEYYSVTIARKPALIRLLFGLLTPWLIGLASDALN